MPATLFHVDGKPDHVVEPDDPSAWAAAVEALEAALRGQAVEVTWEDAPSDVRPNIDYPHGDVFDYRSGRHLDDS